MNEVKYRWILYLISSVILATLCIQVYWNFKNYEIGKQQLLNDVQTSIDKAVDTYYVRLAKNSSFEFIGDSLQLSKTKKNDTIIILKDSVRGKKHIDLKINTVADGVTHREAYLSDSTDMRFTLIDSASRGLTQATISEFVHNITNPLEKLTSRLIVSFTEDDFSLKKIDSLFAEELSNRNLSIEYGLALSGPLHKNDTLRSDVIEHATLKTQTSSPYFLYNNTLTVYFGDITLTVLKRNLIGILLSFILVIGIVASLLYLLKIIKKQKELAEIKNDLISNITHEFKTPIATIGIAMEAVQNFNDSRDPEKNLRYAKIAKGQVDRLNLMVEKLLETASLDSEKLSLNFESHNLVELLEKTVSNEMFSMENKTISFQASEEIILYQIDRFHFENAINNIVDNAIKYGGDEVFIDIKTLEKSIEIRIIDSGNSLKEHHKKDIFEKFYRVPKGNTHDVKGFGIGLYYAKKIIEKHGGHIQLKLSEKTTFKIELPHA